MLLTGEAGGAGGGLVRGIAPEDLRARGVIASGIRRGSLAEFGGEDTVVDRHAASPAGWGCGSATG